MWVCMAPAQRCLMDDPEGVNHDELAHGYGLRGTIIMAVNIRLFPEKYRVILDDSFTNMTVESRGSTGWAIVSFETGETLNRDGDWEYESSPSNRTEDYLARNRYATVEEAQKHMETLMWAVVR